MTEPTTPTGKRLLASDNRHTGPCPSTDDCWSGLSSDILAIEAEARAQERQNIRAACSERNPDHDDRWCRICTDFVDPTDDR